MSSEAGYSIRQQGRSTIQTGPEFVAPKKAAGDEPTPVTMTYTNWRGQTAERTIIPERVWFGSTDWHPEPQWLLRAVDVEKGAVRDFALKDFGHIDPSLARKVLETVNLVVSAVGIDTEGVPEMMLAGVREAIALMGAEPAPVVGSVNLATEPDIACYAVRGPDGRYRPATAAEVEAMWAGSAAPVLEDAPAPAPVAAAGNMADLELLLRGLLNDEYSSLTIGFNDDHACNYATAERYREEWGMYLGNAEDRISWISDAEREKAIRENSVWTIQWYPDSPVGFFCRGASSLAELIRALPTAQEPKP